MCVCACVCVCVCTHRRTGDGFIGANQPAFNAVTPQELDVRLLLFVVNKTMEAEVELTSRFSASSAVADGLGAQDATSAISLDLAPQVSEPAQSHLRSPLLRQSRLHPSRRFILPWLRCADGARVGI